MVAVEEFGAGFMGALLLRVYVGLYSWVVKKLEDIVSYPEDYMLASELRKLQKLHWTGKSRAEIAQLFLQECPQVHPELVGLVLDKLDEQGGGLSYTDRFLATLF